ncbi:MAG: hypothetical protein QOC66_2712 [Pseudonocardiales bacterium]|nr:hypothetical protein [Pseudonocardiales bacterium]
MSARAKSPPPCERSGFAVWIGDGPERSERSLSRSAYGSGQPQKLLPQAQPPPALGLSMVKPCCSIVSVKSTVAPPR